MGNLIQNVKKGWENCMTCSSSRFRRIFILAVKIGMGSSAAIYLANFLHLEFASSCGSIALLTLVTTKWGTVKLSITRLVTFFMAVVLAMATLVPMEREWLSYGIYVFLIVLISEWLGWKATVSVNAVIGTHFLSVNAITVDFIRNEFLLVLIGVSIAFLLNLYHDNQGREQELKEHMRFTENRLQMILGEMAAYLSNKDMQRNVWEDMTELENQLDGFIKEAVEYQDNTFHSHPGYYIDYFEMRMNQCHVLHNLHAELKRMRSVSRQAKIVADYILYMMDYVVEIHVPTRQMEELHEIFEKLKNDELPESREEFENQALLYHILMDLEDFLITKRRFVNSLDQEKKQIYWMREGAEAAAADAAVMTAAATTATASTAAASDADTIATDEAAGHRRML